MAAHKNSLVANLWQKSRVLQRVNEMAVNKNAVAIANIRQKNQPLVVPTPIGRLIIFDTETRLGTWDRIVEIGAVELFNEHPASPGGL